MIFFITIQYLTQPKVTSWAYSLCFDGHLHMKAIFSTICRGIHQWSFYGISLIKLEDYLPLDNQVELIDRVPNSVHLLIAFILFVLEVLNEVFHLFAKSIENRKPLYDLSHLLKLHPWVIYVFVLVLGVLNLNINAILS